MKKFEVFDLIVFLFLGFTLGVILDSVHYENQIKKLSVQSLDQIVDVMYTQKETNGSKAEVEYSIVSNKGYYYNPQTEAHYEFSLDKHGNKVIKFDKDDK